MPDSANFRFSYRYKPNSRICGPPCALSTLRLGAFFFHSVIARCEQRLELFAKMTKSFEAKTKRRLTRTPHEAKQRGNPRKNMCKNILTSPATVTLVPRERLLPSPAAAGEGEK